jgi:hypothetical protein
LNKELRLTLRRTSPSFALGRAGERAWELVRDWYGLPLAFALGLISGLIYIGQAAAPWPIFDDSFISLTFARNLSEHGILSFDGSSWSSGATSPLHVGILAGLLKAGVDPIDASVYLGVAAHALLSVAVYLLAWSIIRNRAVALLAALIISFNGYAALDAGNGLETSLFMALVALTMATFFLGADPRWRIATGLLAALSVLTRPEGAFLIPALLLYRLHIKDRNEDWHLVARDGMLMALPPLLMLAALAGYSFLLTDSLGGTGTAKMEFFRENRLALVDRIGIAGDWMGVFFGGVLGVAVLALFAERRREYLLFALFWAPALVLYTLGFPGGLEHYFYRYQHPVLPFIAVIGGVAVWQSLAWGMRNGFAQKVIVVTGLTAVALLSEQQYERWGEAYQRSAAEAHEDLGAMAIELNQIVKPGETVATHDIGAVSFFAEYRVMDLVGLVNPNVVPYHEERNLMAYLERVRPDYLLTLPNWDRDYLHIYPEGDGRFELVATFPGRDFRPEPYLLYRITWELAPDAPLAGGRPTGLQATP